jgi:tetratricopeptide (TPR) repeat protein
VSARVQHQIPGFPYNVNVRFHCFAIAILCLCFVGVAATQDSPPVEQVPTDKSAPPPKDNAKAPPRSDNVPVGESSSTQTRIDVDPPADDIKSHPESGLDASSEVDEFTPYNPMKALKAVEVGDWYYKQQNYRAAISRYREALEFKPHDAEATFKLAEVLNKTGDLAGAATNYEDYLKTLPNGPHAKKAKETLEKVKAKIAKE